MQLQAGKISFFLFFLSSTKILGAPSKPDIIFDILYWVLESDDKRRMNAGVTGASFKINKTDYKK